MFLPSFYTFQKEFFTSSHCSLGCSWLSVSFEEILLARVPQPMLFHEMLYENLFSCHFRSTSGQEGFVLVLRSSLLQQQCGAPRLSVSLYISLIPLLTVG